MSSIEQAGMIERGERLSAARVRDEAGTRRSVPAREPAPFALRCGALLIDYMLAALIITFSTLLARLFAARAAADSAITVGLILAAIVAALDLIMLPAFTGRTVGKWATGLRVERRDGASVGFARAILRHTVGYLASLVTLGLGFLLAAFNREGRALHDVIAGTVVVRE